MVASKRAPELKKLCVLCLVQLEEVLRLSSISFLVNVRSWARLAERFHHEIVAGYFILISTELGEDVHQIGLLRERLRLCLCLI